MIVALIAASSITLAADAPKKAPAATKDKPAASKPAKPKPAELRAWAEEASVAPNTVILQAGESKGVTVALKINSDAEGTNKFNIEVLSGSNFVLSQPVSVNVEKSGFSLGSDWYLWLIGAFNVLLIAAIIIVVIRILKK